MSSYCIPDLPQGFVDPSVDNRVEIRDQSVREVRIHATLLPNQAISAMDFVYTRTAHRTYSNGLYETEAKYAAATFGMFVTKGATAVSAVVAEQGEIERFAASGTSRLLLECRSREELFQRIQSCFVAPIADLCHEGLMETSVPSHLLTEQQRR